MVALWSLKVHEEIEELFTVVLVQALHRLSYRPTKMITSSCAVSENDGESACMSR
jgi:hypothetical protein